MEEEKRAPNFSLLSGQHAEIVRDQIFTTIETVKSVAALYAASEQVVRAEFSKFIAFETDNISGIQAIEWIPRVKDSKRERFETQAQNDGLAGFRFTEKNSRGEIITAARRDDSFPVYFIEPLKGNNERAVGYDFASNATRLERLNRARDTGLLQVSARVTLVQEISHQYGILVFQPIYRHGEIPQTLTERRELLSGFSIGVIGVGQDITARKLAQAKVIQASKLASLGEMATSVAHELNQPINVIRMAAGNVLRKIDKGNIETEYLIGKLE